MRHPLVSLKLLRASIASLALIGSLAVAIAPAAAFPLVHRNNDGTISIDPLLCYTDYQVRQAIAGAGFTHIFLNAPIEAHIQVRATRGKFVYLIDFNRCTGKIVSAKRLRAA